MRGGVDESSGERRRASRRRPLPLLLPRVILLALPTFLSSASPPLIHFRHCRFAGGNDVAAAADALKPPKRTTSGSRLDAREVVVVGGTSKRRNGPPPARVWTRGRWWWWEACRNGKLDHLRLAFGCEGGGGGDERVETSKKTTSGSRLDAREEVVVAVWV